MTQEQFAAIGEIVVEFHRLEFNLASILARLLSDDFGIGHCVIAKLSFNNTLDALGAIFRTKRASSAFLKTLDKLLGRAQHLNERRNQIVHSFSGPIVAADGSLDPKTIHRIKFSAKRDKGFAMRAERMTIAELKDFAGQIKSLRGDILDFFIKDREQTDLSQQLTAALQRILESGLDEARKT